jgi:hypothetical protein
VILIGLGALPDRKRPPTTEPSVRGGDNDDRCIALLPWPLTIWFVCDGVGSEEPGSCEVYIGETEILRRVVW